MSPRADQKGNTASLLQLLQVKGIKHELLDGADPELKPLRNKLFSISGHRAVYPQVFFCSESAAACSVDSQWYFAGQWSDLFVLNERNETDGKFDALFAKRSAESQNKSDLGKPTSAQHAPVTSAHVDRATSSAGPEWMALKDDDGDTFYYNMRTKETSWDPPSQPVVSGTNQVSANKATEKDANKRIVKSDSPADSKSDSHTADNNESTTNLEPTDPASQHPVVVITEEEFEQNRPDPGESISDWSQHLDEENDPFWYNQRTGESSWYPPIGWEDHVRNQT